MSWKIEKHYNTEIHGHFTSFWAGRRNHFTLRSSWSHSNLSKELTPIQAIPKEWKVYVEPLVVITSFTDQIEGDLNLQQDVYVAVTEVKSKLQALANQNNFVAQELLEKFLKRFETTADLTLAHLAFIFT